MHSAISTSGTEPTPVAGLQAEGILPNVDRMVSSWNAGRLPVLFYALDDLSVDVKWPTAFGWNGKRVHLARMTRPQVTRYADALVWICPDGVASRWLRRKDGAPRLLVFCSRGPLFLNFDAETGFTQEAGT